MIESGASVVLFGGASQSALLNDFWVFNVMSSTWLQYALNDTCISPRYFHAAAKLSLDTIIISGGLSNFTTSSSTVALSDTVMIRINSNQQLQCSSLVALPAPLYGHSMSSTKNGASVILFGGFSKADSGSSHVWLLQNASFDKSAKWLLISASGNPPSPRAFFVSGMLLSGDSTSEILVIWGGLSPLSEVQTPLFTLVHDDKEPAESGWKWGTPVLKGVPPLPRAYAASAYNSRTLCMHGGQSLDGAILQDLWFLDRDIAGFYTWKLQSLPKSAPPVWGHTLTFFATSNQILIYGGQKSDGSIEHEMFAYLIGSGELSFVDFAGDVPAARHSAALSCLGSRLILHGGATAGVSSYKDLLSTNPLNDVWQFDLSNAQWSPLRRPQPAAISNTSNQSSLFSNSSNFTAVLNTSLQTLPEEAAPTLLGHSMVHLGPILIVFGGFSASSGTSSKPVNQLYSLDPRKGQWKKLQPLTLSVPAPRGYQAHAFSPSATFSAFLVVFGGIAEGNQVLGDAWVIPLNLFKRRLSSATNATDRMLAFDFNCRHVAFTALTMKPLGSFSVSFWVFASAIPDEGQFLIGSASQSVRPLIDFAIYALPQSCSLQVSMNVGGQYFAVAGKASVCDIGWHHVAFTFNSASMIASLYMDGDLDAQFTIPVADTLTFRGPFYIGHLPAKSSSSRLQSCWSGFIDRFAFWNSSLTHLQVAAFQFNSSNAYILFDFDSADFAAASTTSSGMMRAVASFGSGNAAQAPVLLPSACPISQSDIFFNFSLYNSWTKLPVGPSNRSHAMMAATTSSDAILFGGRDASGSSLSDLWILRNFDVPVLAKWELVAPVQNMGTPMSHSIISSLGQFQVVIVGYNESSGTQVSLVADIGGHKTQLTKQYFDVRMPPAIGIANCKCIDNTMWTFGGQDAVLDVPFDGLFYSDLTSPFVPRRGGGFSPPVMFDVRHCLVGSTAILLVGRSVVSGAQESYLFTYTSHRWQMLNIQPRVSQTGGSFVSLQDSGDPVVIAFGGLNSLSEINYETHVIYLRSSVSARVVSGRNAPNRTLHAALGYNGMMWVFGGQTSAAVLSFSNEIWVFSLQNLSWTLVVPASSLAPPPIISHVFHPVGHLAVVVGGQIVQSGSAGRVPNLHAWAFDFTTRMWSSAIIPNFAPCIDMAAASHKQYLYVYGGYILGADEVSSNMWLTHTKGNITNWVWKVIRTVGPDPRRGAFLGVMPSSSLLLYGGRSNSVTGSTLTDMWQFGLDVADPQFSRVFGPNSKVAYAGGVNYFDIELRNVFNDVIGNSVHNLVNFWLLFVGNSTRFRGTIEHRPDIIRVIFNPQYVGPHLAFLELNRGIISLTNDNQPFLINVVSSAVVAATSGFQLVFPNGTGAPVDSTLLVAAGDPLVFEIIFLDKLSNAGEYLARVSFEWYKIKIVAGTESSGNPVEYLDSTGTPPVEIKASGGGNVLVTGTLLEVANYSVIVKMGTQLVGGVTYNFTLLSAALDPRSCLILAEESTALQMSDSGLRKYPVGETVRIVVLLRDRFGNNITYNLDDNYFIVRVTASSVPLAELPAGKSDPLPEDVQELLSASNYENDAFSLVISELVIEGLLLPKRIIRFFPFSLGDYYLHLATSDGLYVEGKPVSSRAFDVFLQPFSLTLSAGFPLKFQVFPVFTGYTDKETMLRVIVSAPIAALACGILCSFLLASLRRHLRTRTEKAASSTPKFTREEIKALPPSEIIEVLIKLRYIKAQHRAVLLKMLDEGNTKIWNFFDVFFNSTKGHKLALATL